MEWRIIHCGKKVIISKYGSTGGRWLPLNDGEGMESILWSDVLSVERSNLELF